MMKPTFVIADGRKLLMRNGPTGGSLNDVKKGPTPWWSAPTAAVGR